MSHLPLLFRLTCVAVVVVTLSARDVGGADTFSCNVGKQTLTSCSMVQNNCYFDCRCSSDKDTPATRLVDVICEQDVPEKFYFAYWSFSVSNTKASVNTTRTGLAPMGTVVESTKSSVQATVSGADLKVFASYVANLPASTTAVGLNASAAIIPCLSTNFVKYPPVVNAIGNSTITFSRFPVEADRGGNLVLSTLFVKNYGDENPAYNPVNSFPGTVFGFGWSAPRQCHRFSAYIRNQFLFPNGTLGPWCAAQTDSVDFFLDEVPSAPTNAEAKYHVADSVLIVSWTPSKDDGGCTAHYEVVIRYYYGNENVVANLTIEDITTSSVIITLRGALQNNTQYQVSVECVSVVGRSTASVTDFHTAKKAEGKSLSGGEVAGIVIGAVVLGVLIALIVAYWIKRRGGYQNLEG